MWIVKIYFICGNILIGRITHDNYVQFIRHDALGFEYIDQSKNFVPQVKIKYFWFGMALKVFLHA